MADELNIALVGCGTVGSAVAQILTRDQDVLGRRSAPALRLKYIVDVNFDRARKAGLDESLFCRDLSTALQDPTVGAVVELVGGTTIARDVFTQALQAGKHVVTANKALLATTGGDLFALARENGVSIGLEASCAGGIPIIRALTDGLAANRIEAIYGIVNGTCNYILTEMIDEGMDYAQALSQAQQLGLAVADPTLDVSGGDSAHKLAIMASLAFKQAVRLEDIPVEGIDQLELCDVAYAQELGYVVKLLAIARRQRDGLSLRVCPAFIPAEHPLAWVAGPFNAVSVYGHATGHTMYYGRGAGGMPTASAVVADLMSLAVGAGPAWFENLKVWPDLNVPAVQLPLEAVQTRFYLRIVCRDEPGVLASIAHILGNHEISISSVLQHEVDAMDAVTTPSTCIDIVDEHPERL